MKSAIKVYKRKHTCKKCGIVFTPYKPGSEMVPITTVNNYEGLCYSCNHIIKMDKLSGYYVCDDVHMGTKAHSILLLPGQYCPHCKRELISVATYCDGRTWAEPGKFKIPERQEN